MRISQLPLVNLPTTPDCVLHATVQRAGGKRTPVVVGDLIAPEDAFALIDADEVEELQDLLLCTNDGNEYVPCFTRRGWVKAPV